MINPYTIRVYFTTPSGAPQPVTATKLFMFSQFFTGVVDAKVVMAHETKSDPQAANWLRLNVAGSGPYYLAAHDPSVSLELKAVPHSWLPAPAYNQVNIQITSGSIASLMQSNAINFADTGMTDTQIKALEGPGRAITWQDTGFFDMFAITSGPASAVGPLANVDVRQAMAYALPYQRVLDDVLYGWGERAGSLVMPTAPEYTPAWLRYTTNIANAKALMKAAGNPKVNEPLYYLEGDQDQTSTAILVKAALAQIGVTATLTPETQAGLFDVVDARSTPVAGSKIGPPGLELFNWSGFDDDPSIVLGYWTTNGGINNYALYSNPTVNAINAKYASLPTSPARTAAYRQAQDIIAADAPYIPIAYTGAVTVATNGISGVSYSPGGSTRFWTLHPSAATSGIDSQLF
ncbi:MAG: ABC transporter substrate-binding protein [Solirubrobacteraceae bacterium]|jgi:peptide/nickel transport system substrate-binding protein